MFSGSENCARTPPAALDVDPPASSARSRSSTSTPASARWNAVLVPITPPPTTTTSARAGRAGLIRGLCGPDDLAPAGALRVRPRGFGRAGRVFVPTSERRDSGWERGAGEDSEAQWYPAGSDTSGSASASTRDGGGRNLPRRDSRWARMELTCPKCHGAMRSYERSGILIDQCTECRGVFLDRGELEKLMDAEAEYQREGPAPAAAPAPAAPARTPAWGSPSVQGYDDRHRDDDRYRDDRYRYDDNRRYGKKKKRSFLDDLFD